MRTVHKFRWPRLPDPAARSNVYTPPLDAAGFEMPRAASVVKVEVQDDSFCLWVLLDPDELKVQRRFRIVPTGGIVPEKSYYVGTVLELGGKLVWHVFELDGI